MMAPWATKPVFVPYLMYVCDKPILGWLVGSEKAKQESNLDKLNPIINVLDLGGFVKIL